MLTNSKRIIILGITSFLGCHVASKLVDKGYEITAIVRPISKVKIENIKRNDKIQYIYSDYVYHEDMLKEEKYDVIYVFAWSNMDKKGLVDEKLQREWCDTLLDFLKKIIIKSKIEKVIISGSQAEYGKITTPEANEELKCYPYTAYGREKLRFYYEMKKFGFSKNISVLELRIHSLYGCGDKDKFIYNIICQLCNNECIRLESSCEQKWDFLYVEEAADAFVCSLKKNIPSGIYNIGSGEHYTLKEYILILKKICNSMSRIQFGSENDITAPNFSFITKKSEEILGWKNSIPFEIGVGIYLKNK